MSDPIRHECGIALIRLKKPLAYFEQKYGSPLYGFNKLFLLMEKQHNRGQDGAGIGCVKLNMPRGFNYMFREREIGSNGLGEIFKRQFKEFEKQTRRGQLDPKNPESVKQHFDFGGEVLMGHLRYGTSGINTQSSCHPYYRKSNWPTRNLMVCGNFNMTNVDELNQALIQRGQHPIFDTDTQTILEEIGFHLDEAHNSIYREMRDRGMTGEQIPDVISSRLDMVDVLRSSSEVWDGGYTIAGMTGNGDSFVLRDPRGIRPAHWIETEEFIAFASERVPLMTVFDLEAHDVHEIPPGHVVSIKANGEMRLAQFRQPLEPTPCSFERIYFSRGNDPEIYNERKAMGGALALQILHEIQEDLDNSVFSFIPNTAEIAAYGLLHELRVQRRVRVKEALLQAVRAGKVDEALIDSLILGSWPRFEKIAHKDIKLRTFISQESGRNKMVSHVYDITYDVVKPTDNLVVLDDSIVRGTTLRESIIKILSRTQPTKIIVASTAPQIRYPDCYGIDMSELGKFIAFQAAVELHKDRGTFSKLQELYKDCLEEVKKPKEQQRNLVKEVYAPFTTEEVSAQIARMLYPKNIGWKGGLTILYQTIENLHRCCPQHHGDWYFTGEYPTPGGTLTCNRAYIQYFENRSGRAY